MSKDVLNDLHTELTTQLLKRIKDPECPASVLKEAREMLKDNDIQATEANEGLQSLSGVLTALPFNEDEAGYG